METGNRGSSSTRTMWSSAWKRDASASAASHAPSASSVPLLTRSTLRNIFGTFARGDRGLSCLLLPQPGQHSVGSAGDQLAPGCIADTLIAIRSPPPLGHHHNLPVDLASG